MSENKSQGRVQGPLDPSATLPLACSPAVNIHSINFSYCCVVTLAISSFETLTPNNRQQQAPNTMGNPNLDLSLEDLIKKSRTKTTKQGGQAKKPAPGQKGQAGGKAGGQKQAQPQQKPGSKAKAMQQQKQGQKQGAQQQQKQGQLKARGAGIQKAGVAGRAPIKVCRCQCVMQ